MPLKQLGAVCRCRACFVAAAVTNGRLPLRAPAPLTLRTPPVPQRKLDLGQAQPLGLQSPSLRQSRPGGDASLRSLSVAPGHETEVWRNKDGRAWRIGRDAEIAWINENTTGGMAITCAIPPMFDAYATVQLPVTPNGGGWVWNEPPDHHDASLVSVLSEQTAEQPWWLGYLETGIAAETIFYDVPKVRLYGWEYVLIEAGPKQAGRWRAPWGRWNGVLPDLMFPADRSWLASILWDDYYTCIGGPKALVEAFLAHPELRHRAIEVDVSEEDVRPA